MARNLNTLMDRVAMVSHSNGGLDLNAAASVQMTWNATRRAGDTDSIVVDLPNNRIQLKETGWYSTWANVSCVSGTAQSYQGALRAYLAGSVFLDTFASQGLIYTPIGVTGTTLTLPPFLFENTVADQYLDLRVTRLLTSAGTINTTAFGTYWGVQYHGT